MGKNPRGSRHQTRETYRKGYRQKGLAPLGNLLIEYKVNDRVDIIPDPSEQKTLPHRRFCGKVGTIIDIRGRAYQVELKDGNKVKSIFLRIQHIRPHAEG